MGQHSSAVASGEDTAPNVLVHEREVPIATRQNESDHHRSVLPVRQGAGWLEHAAAVPPRDDAWRQYSGMAFNGDPTPISSPALGLDLQAFRMIDEAESPVEESPMSEHSADQLDVLIPDPDRHSTESATFHEVHVEYHRGEEELAMLLAEMDHLEARIGKLRAPAEFRHVSSRVRRNIAESCPPAFIRALHGQYVNFTESDGSCLTVKLACANAASTETPLSRDCNGVVLCGSWATNQITQLAPKLSTEQASLFLDGCSQDMPKDLLAQLEKLPFSLRTFAVYKLVNDLSTDQQNEALVRLMGTARQLLNTQGSSTATSHLDETCSPLVTMMTEAFHARSPPLLTPGCRNSVALTVERAPQDCSKCALSLDSLLDAGEVASHLYLYDLGLPPACNSPASNVIFTLTVLAIATGSHAIYADLVDLFCKVVSASYFPATVRSMACYALAQMCSPSRAGVLCAKAGAVNGLVGLLSSCDSPEHLLTWAAVALRRVVNVLLSEPAKLHHIAHMTEAVNTISLCAALYDGPVQRQTEAILNAIVPDWQLQREDIADHIVKTVLPEFSGVSCGESNPVCNICLLEVGDDPACALPCFHVFHSPCAKEWLQRNLSCPICRADVLDLVHEIRQTCIGAAAASPSQH